MSKGHSMIHQAGRGGARNLAQHSLLKSRQPYSQQRRKFKMKRLWFLSPAKSEEGTQHSGTNMSPRTRRHEGRSRHINHHGAYQSPSEGDSLMHLLRCRQMKGKLASFGTNLQSLTLGQPYHMCNRVLADSILIFEFASCPEALS